MILILSGVMIQMGILDKQLDFPETSLKMEYMFFNQLLKCSRFLAPSSWDMMSFMVGHASLLKFNQIFSPIFHFLRIQGQNLFLLTRRVLDVLLAHFVVESAWLALLAYSYRLSQLSVASFCTTLHL